MNQIASYHHPDVHQSPMATTHAPPPVSGPGAMSGHYNGYQAPIMQSGHPPYSSSPASYGPYAYPAYSAAPVTSSMSNLATPAPIQSMQAAPVSSLPGTQNYPGHTLDTTGQIAPPGVKPRVTATLWEDEGSLCFQVEAKGICVARREDNHMINGTKLLNVAGMTRGRRDGILKSEKVRHVVKIGPMHLKGVWIPFDRALDFANREKITDLLYPLFVHDIGALLYHPSNPGQARPGLHHTTQALQAFDRKREQRMMTGTPQTPQGSSLQSMMPQGPSSAQAAPRPGLDRAHTFPTPPASASSVGMNAQGAPYESWNSSVSQPLSIDTGLSNQRSVPNTPASTPPGKATQGSTHYPTPQSYDASRSAYSNQANQGSYPSQQVRFGGPLQPGFKEESEQDSKYSQAPAPYGSSQPNYSYNPNPSSGSGAEVSRVGELTSPSQNGARPGSRAPLPQTQWSSGYPTPQRSNTAPASNVYNVMDRNDPSNGGPDPYYSSGPPMSNGTIGMKRGRDDDDVEEDAKRQRTDHDDGGPVGGAASPYAVNGARAPVPRR